MMAKRKRNYGALGQWDLVLFGLASAAALIVVTWSGGVAACAAAPLVTDNEVTWNKHLAEQMGAKTPTLFDGSMPDLVTTTHAIEVDWCDRKWRESIGQAFLYAELTGKAPAVLLLVKDRDAERVEMLRAFIACRAAGVRLYLFDCRKAEFFHEVFRQ